MYIHIGSDIFGCVYIVCFWLCWAYYAYTIYMLLWWLYALSMYEVGKCILVQSCFFHSTDCSLRCNVLQYIGIGVLKFVCHHLSHDVWIVFIIWRLFCARLFRMRCLWHWHGTHKIKHIQQPQSNDDPNLNRIDNEKKGETNGVEAQYLYTYRKPNQCKYGQNVERKKRTGLRKNRMEHRKDKIGKNGPFNR